MKGFLLASLVGFVSVLANEDPSAHFPGVVDLTSQNFDSEVIQSGKTWFIEFYAPWCGWCKRIAPVMKELGAEYVNAENVKIGKFDCTQGNSDDVKKRYGITGFPTLLLFPTSDPSHPLKYGGQRTIQDFKSYISQHAPAETKEAETKEAEDKPEAPALDAGKVVNLNPQNFQSVVNDPTKNVFVKFYAPWCGHCRHLEPTYDQLAGSLKDRSDIVIARLDASAHPDVARPYGVAGFPTLKYFPKGDKSGVEYHGDRSLASLKGFVEGRSQ